MSEICQHCGKEYVPNSDMVTVFKTCSNTCRGALYNKKERIRKIENNDYDNLRVKTIKELGYHITVSREGFGDKT